MLELFPDSARDRRRRSSRSAACARRELAERFGTPLVVYCEETIRSQARALREAVGARRTRLLRDEGLPERRRAPAPARGGRRRGRRLRGRARVRARRRALGRRARRAREQQGRGVAREMRPGERAAVVLDAPDEAALAAAAGVERVLVRVTLGVDADTHEAIVTGHHGSKFGLPPAEAQRARRGRARARARRPRAPRPRRLAAPRLHGAGGDDPPARRVRRATAATSSAGKPRVADLGGGFGIRHHPDDDVPRGGRARARPRQRPRARHSSRPASRAVGLARAGTMPRRAGRESRSTASARSSGSPSGRGSRSTAGCRTTRARSSTTRATRRSSAARADEAADELVSVAGHALRVGRRAHRRRRPPRAAARRPARDPGDGCVHARDELELQRRRPTRGRARPRRRGAPHPSPRDDSTTSSRSRPERSRASSFCDELGSHGFGWVVEEAMTRASHALAADGRVWLVDPARLAGGDRARARPRRAGRRDPAPRPPQPRLRRARRAARRPARRGARRAAGEPVRVRPGRAPEALAGDGALVAGGEDARRRGRARDERASSPAARRPVGVHLLLRLEPRREASASFEPEHLLTGPRRGPPRTRRPPRR